jgi:hypothetical protein
MTLQQPVMLPSGGLAWYRQGNDATCQIPLTGGDHARYGRKDRHDQCSTFHLAFRAPQRGPPARLLPDYDLADRFPLRDIQSVADRRLK